MIQSFPSTTSQLEPIRSGTAAERWSKVKVATRVTTMPDKCWAGQCAQSVSNALYFGDHGRKIFVPRNTRSRLSVSGASMRLSRARQLCAISIIAEIGVLKAENF